MIRKLLVGVAAAALVPTAALASPTFDAFTAFNGTQGAGGFYYGELQPDGFGGAFFGANTNCFIDGAVCLQRSANHDVPGFTKGGSAAFQYNSVNVPQDRLLVHPATTIC